MVQKGILNLDCLRKAERLLPYIVLHDTPAFLKCPLAPGAAYRDLQHIQGIREFRKHDQPIAERVLFSLRRQTWYLDEPWLITALVGREVPVEEKTRLAKALFRTPRPVSYPPFCVAPKLPKQKVHKDTF